MKLWAITAAVATFSAAIAAHGLWSFQRSFAQIPANLQTIVGIASAVEVSTARYSQSHVSFKLTQADGASTHFSYRPMFSGFYRLASMLKEGMTVEVTIGPGGSDDFWGLKLGTEVLMSAADAYDSRRQDGNWSLALFVGFLVSAVWSAREVPSLRRRGV